MRQLACLLILCCLAIATAGAGDPTAASVRIPDGLHGQSFGVQWYRVDTTVFINGQEPEARDQFLRLLEAEWERRPDPVLRQVADLIRFRLQLISGSEPGEIIGRMEAWMVEQSGPDVASLQAVANQMMAEHYWKQKDFSAGLEHYIRAYSLYRGLDPARFPMKSQYLYDYASQYYHFRDFRTVKDLLLEMWQTIPLAYVENKVTSLNTLGLCYGQLAQYDSSGYYFQRGLDFISAPREHVWKGIIQGNLAMNLIQQERYEEAVPLLEANIVSSRDRGAMADLALSLVGLGEIRLHQERPREALELIQEGYDILESRNKFKSPVFQSRVFVPLGKALMANGRAEEAFRFLDLGRIARDSVETQRNTLFLSGVQHKLETEQHLAEISEQERALKQQRMMIAGMGIIALAISIFTLVFFRQRNRIARERQRSDHLLLNILPEEVALNLKKEGRVTARHYPSVTILFTDFKGFTRMAEQLSADDLVRELDHYFRRFDEITSSFGLEKIKTIGDAYMAASGLPTERPDHATQAVDAALAIRDMMREEQQVRQAAGKPWFEVRIGLHSGPVVAGVIGLHKFSYDIWGDTVNTAARMESSGEVGRVNISEATSQLVGDRYDCQYRGKLPAKNKGEIGMYFVETRQAARSDDPA